MAIGEKQRKEIDEFDAPRVYTEAELVDFHTKIQRFYETRETKDGSFRKLNYDKFAVAFGAFREVPGANGGVYHLANSERYRAMANLLKQYESWRATKDAKREFAEKKQMEELAKQAEEDKTF